MLAMGAWCLVWLGVAVIAQHNTTKQNRLLAAENAQLRAEVDILSDQIIRENP